VRVLGVDRVEGPAPAAARPASRSPPLLDRPFRRLFQTMPQRSEVIVHSPAAARIATARREPRQSLHLRFLFKTEPSIDK